MNLQTLLQKSPIIPILNEVTPDDILPVGEAFVDNGFLCLEIPLTASDAFSSLEQLIRRFSGKVLVGAGTVTRMEEIDIVKQLRGQIIMMSHTDVNLIRKAKEKGLYCLAGVSTPTEAFTAIESGADALRLFPAPVPSVFRNLKKVFPKGTLILPAGSIELETLPHYWEAGAAGFAMDVNFSTPKYSFDEVNKKAKQFYSAMQSLT